MAENTPVATPALDPTTLALLFPNLDSAEKVRRASVVVENFARAGELLVAVCPNPMMAANLRANLSAMQADVIRNLQ